LLVVAGVEVVGILEAQVQVVYLLDTQVLLLALHTL
jgi:hypothetical protein